jgi:DNA-binding MarR family transcriptional regulator
MDYGFLTDMVGLELRKAQSQTEKKFDQLFNGDLLPGHYTVLVLIKNNPGSTQSSIAQYAGLDRSSLVPLLKQFEKRGFITRKKATNDARSNITIITPAGEDFIQRHRATIEELEHNIKKAFGPKNYSQLVKFLKQLQDHP